jgi:hypothetical protein
MICVSGRDWVDVCDGVLLNAQKKIAPLLFVFGLIADQRLVLSWKGIPLLSPVSTTGLSKVWENRSIQHTLIGITKKFFS